MVGMNNLCEGSVAGRSQPQCEYRIPRPPGQWKRPSPPQEHLLTYDRLERIKSENITCDTLAQSRGPIHPDAVHPLSLPKASGRSDQRRLDRRDVNICELPPMIEFRPVRCIMCGVNDTTGFSTWCRKCELGCAGTPNVMLKKDLEFLHTLKQEARPGSLKRIRAGHTQTQHQKLSESNPIKAGTSYKRIIEDEQCASPDLKRRRRHDEWTRAEIVILLQCTKLLIDCELKCVSQALYHFTTRKPGKCYGRAAEKKLKRLEVFENWRKCNKDAVIARINLMLRHYDAMEIPQDIILYCDGLKATSANRSLALAKALINAS